MKMQKKALSIAMLALGAGLFANASIAAEPARETRSVTVNVADVDVDAAGAAETVYARLGAAARTACGAPGGRNLAMIADWRQCRVAALDDAVAKVADARLTALHEERTRRASLIAAQPAQADGYSGS